MSDIKRPVLIPFSAHKVDEKKCKENGKTIRITLVLPESNEDTCPEYNYKEELAAAKGKSKSKLFKPTTNGLDPFNDDDDDVRRIAQEMEARHGSSGPKKRRKGRRDDYADIGMGYDESDSFIDNTHGYDEIIPQNVTTLHGGFYINSGALEFKTDDEASSKISSSSSSEDEGDDDASVKGVKRKKVLNSSNSESEGEKETDKDTDHYDKKIKIQLNGIDEERKPKKKLLTPEKIKQLKKKRTEERKKHTIKELLGEKLEEENNQVKTATAVDKPDSHEELRDSMKENKKPAPTDNVTDVIESVIKDKVVNVIPSSDGENSNDDKREYEIVKLPENLPNDIVDIIEKIKQHASKNAEGKMKLFSGPVCDTLLKLERKCKCLGRQSRMKIYEHLSPFVKCKKETLMRRTKNLVLEDDQKRLKTLVNRLKDGIDKIMPALLESYHEKESLKKMTIGNLSSEDNKQVRMPKRRFTWTEDIKKWLKEIVILKKRCFLSEGKHKDNLETLICTYLKTEIQPLWPEGWMSMTTLQKTSNLVLGDSKKSLSSAPPTVTKNPIAATSQSLESHVKEIQKLTSNSNLSITPVTSAPQKSVNTNQVDSVVKPRNVNKSDITINKIENSDINQSKSTNKPPLPAEIIKTSNSLTIIPTSTMTIKTSSSERMKRIDFVEPKKDEVPEDLHGKHNENHNSTKEAHKSKEHSKSEKPDSNHCQIIDLTDTLTAELKKEKKSLHHKNRTKLFEGPEKGLIRVKTDLMKVKSDKDEMNTKICENLNELMQQNMSTKASTSTSSASIGSHGKSKDSANQYSPFSTTPPLDYQMMKSSNEGDDIHKAMENLKALQRLSSPAKSNEALTSSPVSVIAYNKSYSPKGVLHNAGSLPQAPPNVPLRGDYKGDFGSGFQEVFQRQFLNEFTMMQNSVNHSASTSSKGHFNSSDKYPHTPDVFINEKYFPNSNNNYPQQNSSKMKNLLPQQSGSYNILDDMLANFLTEYGHPKAGGHIPKQPQK